jgi:hexosaminidase
MLLPLVVAGVLVSGGVAPVLESQTVPADAAYAVIPRPAVLTPAKGHYAITPATVVRAPSAFRRVARRFVRDVAPATGFDLSIAPVGTGGGGITLRKVPGLPREGYRLDVSPQGIMIQASDSAGAFYALETVKQLLPPAIYREAEMHGMTWHVPAVHIEDAPRFPWRGSHMDVGRHFQPKAFVKKYIDLLARHKLNRFHWHLTEDQGWRLEIRKYPRLTEVGSCRENTLVGSHTDDPARQVFDGRRHCGHYTQEDVREIVAYAAERMVTVVPEIEMPGHAQAAVFAYPFLASTTDSIPGLRRIWGVSPYIINPSDRSVAFMQDVLTEVMALFPSPWIHIGGDEAVKDQWKANPEIQARIKSLGLKDEHEMQSWFIRRMDAFLTQRGRRLIGWDEILEGGLAENATVMSWRGMAGGIDAARQGHDVVMAPGSHTYFDHYQSQDKANEPLAIGGFTNLEKVYGFEPVPAELTPKEATHILGAQSQLWTEYIPNPRQLEYMAFPRLVALCEAVWSGKSRRDYGHFMQRLPVHLRRLDALDVNYRRLDGQAIVP